MSERSRIDVLRTARTVEEFDEVHNSITPEELDDAGIDAVREAIVRNNELRNDVVRMDKSQALALPPKKLAEAQRRAIACEKSKTSLKAKISAEQDKASLDEAIATAHRDNAFSPPVRAEDVKKQKKSSWLWGWFGSK